MSEKVGTKKSRKKRETKVKILKENTKCLSGNVNEQRPLNCDGVKNVTHDGNNVAVFAFSFTIFMQWFSNSSVNWNLEARCHNCYFDVHLNTK